MNYNKINTAVNSFTNAGLRLYVGRGGQQERCAESMIKISPSILTADFMNLSGAVRALEDAGADFLHFDVMDGVFVPNLSIGFPVLASVHAGTRLPLDVHLMLIDPRPYLERFAQYAERITVHLESQGDPAQTLRRIRALGCRAGLTIKPATPAQAVFPYLDDADMVLIMSVEPGFGGQAYLPQATDKLAAVRAERDRRGLSLDLEVDGGINLETAPLACGAGADILVAGSQLFSAPDMAAALRELRAAAGRGM